MNLHSLRRNRGPATARAATPLVAKMLATTLLMSCATARDHAPSPHRTDAKDGAAAPARLADLAGTSWTCTRIEGVTIPAGVSPTLAFGPPNDSGGLPVSGFAGVNRFGGTVTAVGAGIAFGPMMATRMAGPADRMELEAAYLGVFHAVDAARLSGDTLTLLDGPGPVATFTRETR